MDPPSHTFMGPSFASSLLGTVSPGPILCFFTSHSLYPLRVSTFTPAAFSAVITPKYISSLDLSPQLQVNISNCLMNITPKCPSETSHWTSLKFSSSSLLVSTSCISLSWRQVSPLLHIQHRTLEGSYPKLFSNFTSNQSPSPVSSNLSHPLSMSLLEANIFSLVVLWAKSLLAS